MASDWSWVGEVGSAIGSIVKNINWNKKDKGATSSSNSNVMGADYIKSSSGKVLAGQSYIPTLAIPSGMYVGVDSKVWDINPIPTNIVGARTGAKNIQSVLEQYDVVGKDSSGNDLHLLKPQYRVKAMNPQPTIQVSKNASGMGSAASSIFGALASLFGGADAAPDQVSSGGFGSSVKGFLGALLPVGLLAGAGYFGYSLYKKYKR